MTEPSKEDQGEFVKEQAEEPKEESVTNAQEAAQSEEPRRSDRARTLTEKGRALQSEKLKSMLLRFEDTYNCWKVLAKAVKKSVSKKDSSDILQERVSRMQKEQADLNSLYEAYRTIDIPPQAMRSKLDKSTAITQTVRQNAALQMQGASEEIAWPDGDSVFASTTSSISLPACNVGETDSIHSYASMKRQEIAAAEYTHTRAVLRIMAEQERCQEELQALDIENKKVAAEQEAEAKARRLLEEKEEIERKIERQKQEAALLRIQEEEKAIRIQSAGNLKRELERLEKLKSLNAAKARLPVYKETDADLEVFAPEPQQTSKKASRSEIQTVNIMSSSDVPKEDSTDLIKLLAEAISANRLPVPEPTVFCGDPLKFSYWKCSFQTLIERKNIPVAEKMFFLQKYVGGAVREALEGNFLLDSQDSYNSAWDLLNERYGQPFVIAKAFRDKLYAWPKISTKESGELRRFVDFLRSCDCAMAGNENLHVLDDAMENQKLAAKLPDWLSTRWNRRATQYQLEHARFPKFNYFVTFLSMEAAIACNPITSHQALQPYDSDKARTKNPSTAVPKTQTFGAKTFTTSTNERSLITCILCNRTGHSLQKCRKFLERPLTGRVKFIQDEKLCFGCLNPGHQSKSCSKRMFCDVCSRRHPTCLHEDRSQQQHKEHFTVVNPSKEQLPSTSQDDNIEVTSNRVMQHDYSVQTSAIVPVYVSSDSDKEVLVYALLDSQSDSSFILEEVADALELDMEPVKLKLSTMSSRGTTISCKRLKGLQIRGLASSKRITVPTAYTREFIPANRSHIPTAETARAWPHLKHLAQHISPQRDCEIGLLIGYNCPQALMPREVVCGEGSQAFAQRTDLGWSIVSYIGHSEHHSDAIGVSHRIIVKQVIPQPKPSVQPKELQPPVHLKGEVHFVLKTQIKEMVTPEDVMKVLESDFSEQTEDATFSQEDCMFLTKLKDGIRHKPEGHLEMPLPFKQERPRMPNNMSCAVQRLMCLGKRLKKDQKYCSDYISFMEDLITSGDAEMVPKEQVSSCPAWYIPHHGINHPKKPGKIRVVFDCSVRFQETSLNDHLLTGPELTNTLLGVLCRFRKGPIAIMCDIERMFHQFHVKPEDRDYLRVLWWEKG